jgi:hypothetical protein
MEWKTLDALLEGEEPDEMYLFLREVGIVFEMSVEQVMANAEITFAKNSAEKEKGPAMPTPDPSHVGERD